MYFRRQSDSRSRNLITLFEMKVFNKISGYKNRSVRMPLLNICIIIVIIISIIIVRIQINISRYRCSYRKP